MEDIDSLYSKLDRLDVDEVLVRRAGELRLLQKFGSRGYEAIHLAGPERPHAPQFVLADGGGGVLNVAFKLRLTVTRDA